MNVSLTGNDDSFVRDGRCKHYTKPTHTSHSRTRDFFFAWLKTSVIESIEIVVSRKTVILHIYHSMSHAPSLLFLSHLSTTSLSTCTPVQLSNRPSLMSASHGDLPCAVPSNVSFGPLAETHSPTGYDPKTLIEGDSMEIKPMFFHRPSMTSTYDSSGSIATPLS